MRISVTDDGTYRGGHTRRQAWPTHLHARRHRNDRSRDGRRPGAPSGHEVVCFIRPRARVNGSPMLGDIAPLLRAMRRSGSWTPPILLSLARDGFAGERFDAVVSCMASRTGAPKSTPGPSTIAPISTCWDAAQAVRRRPLCVAVRHLRAKAAPGLSTGQVGLRGGADRSRACAIRSCGQPPSSSRCQARSSA